MKCVPEYSYYQCDEYKLRIGRTARWTTKPNPPYLSQAVVPLCYRLLQLIESLGVCIKGIPEHSYLIK